MSFLKSRSFAATTAVLALGAGATGCGLIQELADDFFPTLEFSVPETLYTSDARIAPSTASGTRTRAGEDAGDEAPTGPLGMMADRMERSVDDINLIFERLNNDGITGEGTFTGKGPEGTISGKVTALTDDADYDYEAVICVSGEAFQQVKWNEEKTKVQVIRDFMKTPIPGGNDAPEGTTFVGKVTYDASDSDAVSTLLQVTGTPWRKPLDITDTSLVAYELGVTDADGNLTMSGVNDWYSESFPSSPEGHSYIVGQLSADGASGSSLGYRADANECSGVSDFDESAPEWCLGKDLTADAPYTSEEMDAAWTALQEAGVELTSDANLAEITLPSGLTCE